MAEPHERLREARLKAGFERPAAASMAFGWSRETYKSHENGQRGIRPDAAERYARAFRVSAAWILTGEDTQPMSAAERVFLMKYRDLSPWARSVLEGVADTLIKIARGAR